MGECIGLGWKSLGTAVQCRWAGQRRTGKRLGPPNSRPKCVLERGRGRRTESESASDERPARRRITRAAFGIGDPSRIQRWRFRCGARVYISEPPRPPLPHQIVNRDSSPHHSDPSPPAPAHLHGGAPLLWCCCFSVSPSSIGHGDTGGARAPRRGARGSPRPAPDPAQVRDAAAAPGSAVRHRRPPQQFASQATIPRRRRGEVGRAQGQAGRRQPSFVAAAVSW